MEIKLRDAQQIKAIGRLAEEVAHEINTPAQYIGDNLRFLKDAFDELQELIQCQEQLLKGFKTNTWTDNQVAEAEKLSKAVEADCLATEIPNAISDALDGIERVTRVVLALRERSLPNFEEL
jgi:signal transduction histidine kinase